MPALTVTHGGRLPPGSGGKPAAAPPQLPLSPQLQASAGCVSARWRRAVCQEIIAIKNSLGFILSFYFFRFRLGSPLPLKEATKLPPVTLFNCL